MNQIQQLQQLFEQNSTTEDFLQKTISSYKGNSVDELCTHIASEIKIQLHFPLERINMYTTLTKRLNALDKQIESPDLKETINEVKTMIQKYSNESIYFKPQHFQLSELYK